jgi:hypothetical protein
VAEQNGSRTARSHIMRRAMLVSQCDFGKMNAIPMNAGTHLRREGNVQAGIRGVAQTQEAHTALVAVAVAADEATYVSRHPHRCFARNTRGGQCRQARHRNKHVCSGCNELGRSADPAILLEHEQQTAAEEQLALSRLLAHRRSKRGE